MMSPASKLVLVNCTRCIWRAVNTSEMGGGRKTKHDFKGGWSVGHQANKHAHTSHTTPSRTGQARRDKHAAKGTLAARPPLPAIPPKILPQPVTTNHHRGSAAEPYVRAWIPWREGVLLWEKQRHWLSESCGFFTNHSYQSSTSVS